MNLSSTPTNLLKSNLIAILDIVEECQTLWNEF